MVVSGSITRRCGVTVVVIEASPPVAAVDVDATVVVGAAVVGDAAAVVDVVCAGAQAATRMDRPRATGAKR
jgi:hypothetical protein